MKPIYSLGCLYKVAFAVALVLFGICCSSDDDNEPGVTYQGIIIFDINGSPLGCHQVECADDWKWEGISEEEEALIGIDPSLDISQARLSGSGTKIYPYPVPVTKGSPMGFSIESDGDLVFSIVLVHSETVLSQASLILPSTRSAIQLSPEFFSRTIPKTTYRMYYGLFNRNGEGLDFGYGDIAVCAEGTNPANYLDCLPD